MDKPNLEELAGRDLDPETKALLAAITRDEIPMGARACKIILDSIAEQQQTLEYRRIYFTRARRLYLQYEADNPPPTPWDSR